MYARLPNLIQGQGQLAAKLTFQPASLQASTCNICCCAGGHACVLRLKLPALAARVPSMHAWFLHCLTFLPCRIRCTAEQPAQAAACGH